MSKLADETSSDALPSLPVKPGPSRRSSLEYFNPAKARDRFWRLISSRNKVVENTKNFAWVGLITLVIWIYAEREQIVVPTGPNVQNVPIQIYTNDPNRDVEMVGGSDHYVNLKLTGPQQAFEKVRAQLISSIPRGLKINLESNGPIGKNQSINIVDRIQNMDLFRSNGVTVQEAQPSTIAVNIDRMIHRKLPVQVPPEITNLTAETHFTPAEVTVSGPESLLLPLIQDGGLKVFANLARNEQLKVEGPHSIPSVPVNFSSPQDRLRIEPALVKADIVVRASDVQYVIKSLPIYVDIAPGTLKNFDLVITNGEALSDVSVSGPQDKINALRENAFVPRAVLEIVPEDSAAGQAKKPVNIILPEGVQASPEARGYQVEFTLTRKQ